MNVWGFCHHRYRSLKFGLTEPVLLSIGIRMVISFMISWSIVALNFVWSRWDAIVWPEVSSFLIEHEFDGVICRVKFLSCLIAWLNKSRLVVIYVVVPLLSDDTHMNRFKRNKIHATLLLQPFTLFLYVCCRKHLISSHIGLFLFIENWNSLHDSLPSGFWT